MLELMFSNKRKVLDSSVVMYAPMNEAVGVTDVYEYANEQNIVANLPKTITNAKDGDRPVGVFNGAVRFQTSLKRTLAAKDFTVEIWARIAAANVNATMMMLATNSNGAAGSAGINIGISAGKIYVVTTTGSSRITTGVVPADQWFHMCVQRNSGTGRVFLNGTNIITPYADSNNLLASTMMVGAYFGGATPRYVTGLLSEAMVSDVAKYDIYGFTPTYPLF